MPQTQFKRPIYISRAHFIEEVTHLEAVLDFLEEWPESRRDLAFDTLRRACLSAHHGRFPIEAAGDNFRRFLKRVGMLLDVDDVHISPDDRTGQSAGRA